MQRSIEAERARQAEIERRAETLRREIERLRAEFIAAARALQSEEGNLSGVEGRHRPRLTRSSARSGSCRSGGTTSKRW